MLYTLELSLEQDLAAPQGRTIIVSELAFVYQQDKYFVIMRNSYEALWEQPLQSPVPQLLPILDGDCLIKNQTSYWVKLRPLHIANGQNLPRQEAADFLEQPLNQPPVAEPVNTTLDDLTPLVFPSDIMEPEAGQAVSQAAPTIFYTPHSPMLDSYYQPSIQQSEDSLLRTLQAPRELSQDNWLDLPLSVKDNLTGNIFEELDLLSTAETVPDATNLRFLTEPSITLDKFSSALPRQEEQVLRKGVYAALSKLLEQFEPHFLRQQFNDMLGSDSWQGFDHYFNHWLAKQEVEFNRLFEQEFMSVYRAENDKGVSYE